METMYFVRETMEIIYFVRETMETIYFFVENNDEYLENFLQILQKLFANILRNYTKNESTIFGSQNIEFYIAINNIWLKSR